ncbi:MAG: PatB family C-S lyase [Clostridiales bacterium]|nr:PatB family C-S lyase [Clostridiales bacterium]
MSRFDIVRDRRNTGSLKWEVAEGELPMWVADMDFETAPAVAEAVGKRAAYGIFGYASVPDEWYSAYMSWWRKRHGFGIEKDWLIFVTGIVPAISSIVRRITLPAEKVLIPTPAYGIFFNSVLNNGRVALESRLIRGAGGYRMDFEDLERKCADPQTRLFILCNPQNPTGTVWDRETLARIGEICKANGVAVISDEIHCDLTLPGVDYTPFASVSETCREISVSCLSPTKTFNIAGLQTAAVAVPDRSLRERIERGFNNDEIAEGNAFAYDAAIAAFGSGGEWLDELRGYLSDNRRLAEEKIASSVPNLSAVHGEATYLLWIDVRRTGLGSREFAARLRKETGLYLSDGSGFRGEGGEGFLRMNLACPRSVLSDGLSRLERFASGLF